MKEKLTQGKKDIKVTSVGLQAVEYSISGSYGDYEFQAIVADYDDIDGLDGGCIQMLHIERKANVNGKNETVFDFSFECQGGRGTEEDAEECKHIRTYLENLPLDRHERMLSLGDA